ncbi:MAG: hypothetical protein QF367_10325 [Acidimicrobiales bacterium]|nr:hypothetical protein [Actinomycetes bacterium]MDP6105775.1 hypothetical protein [Acidimicrobiales bacterium]MDP6240606.1 hypothetical protein [Acidimicrobiales bacterium]MDP7125636.1 hypothetical protein [Acidimicrobiales bacterium]MDP7352779.1 hypothetical protein [Acidimicrobiales bacterium]
MVIVFLIVGACATAELPRGATSGTSSSTLPASSTAIPVVSTTAPPPTSTTVVSTTAPPRTTTTAQWSDVPEGFCAGLAVESARITQALEELDASGPSDAARLLAHLRATTALVGWIDGRAPAGLQEDSGLFGGVYSNVDIVLADLDPEMVTDSQLRNALFGALMDSPVDGQMLDGAAGRVADWVDGSCGVFPMVAFVADLFAAARQADGDELVFEFPG